MAEINYPELGDISEARTWHDVGAVVWHPAGSKYQLTKDGWVLVKHPKVKA